MPHNRRLFAPRRAAWCALAFAALSSPQLLAQESPAGVTGVAQPIYVDDDAAEGGDGTSWATAYKHLADALAVAVAGTDVWIAAGRYYPDRGSGRVDNDREATFTLPSGVHLLGGFAGTESSSADRNRDLNVTVLSGDIDGNDTVDANGITANYTQIAGLNTRHLITTNNPSSNTRIDGLVLTAGQATLGSGDQVRGAIVYCPAGGTLTLQDVTVVGARSSNRGALYNCAEFIVDGSEFVNLRADDVGAVSNSGGTFTDTLFLGNSAANQAAVFYLGANNLTLRNVSFIANSSGSGAGALRTNGGFMDLENVLFSGNVAANGAAMTFGVTTNASLRNVTVTGNRSSNTTSGGLQWSSSGTLEIVNSIFWNNANASGTGTLDASLIVSGGSSMVADHSLLQGSGGSAAWVVPGVTDGGANLDADPLFSLATDPAAAPTASGDAHPDANSPAVNAGDDAEVTLTTDLDGATRIQGAAVDLGPYEYTPLVPDVRVHFPASAQSTTAGATRDYELIVSNIGNGAASGVLLQNSFAAVLTCNWTATASDGASGQADGSGVLSQTLSLPAGAMVTYDIHCLVDGDASGQLSHTTTASVVAGELNTSNNDFTVLASIQRVTAVSVSLADGNADAVAGSAHPMTLLLSNAGPSNAHDAALVVDFDAAVACSWTSSGTSGASGVASGSGDIAHPVDLPAGSTLTYAISCAVPAGLSGSFATGASIDAVDTDPNGNDSAQDSTNVVRSNSLGVTLADADAAAVPGSVYALTLVAANNGPSDAPGSTLAVDLDDTLGCSWTATMAGGATGTLQGSGDIAQLLGLPTGASATYSIQCLLPSSHAASLSTTATLTATSGASASATEGAPLARFANLSAAIDDGRSALDAGDSTTYTLVIGNAGPSDAPGSQVTAAFPAPLVCSWTCSAAAGSQCGTAQGSGDIAQTVTVASGVPVTFVAQCSVPADASFASITVTSAVAAAANVTDAASANDAASDVNGSLIEQVFADGFE